jgi:hypothetical protein
MTITATAPVSLADVLAELRVVNPGRSLPISLGDADVRNLAGIASGPIALGDLKGKTSYIAMSGSMDDVDMSAIANPPVNINVDHAVSITIAGGLAPFTYAWSHVSGPGTVDAVNAASSVAHMPVAHGSSPGAVSVQTVQCTVTDAMANIFTRQCSVTLTLE